METNWSVGARIIAVGRGSNTYFMQKYDNKFLTFICCCYSGFCLSVLNCTYDLNDTHFHYFLVGKPTKSARDQIIIAPPVYI